MSAGHEPVARPNETGTEAATGAGTAADDALSAALAALREPRAPDADLWPELAERIGATRPGQWRDRAVDEPPARELWPGIEARIRRGELRRRRAPWWSAAALAASLVAGLSVQVLREQGAQLWPGASPAMLAERPAAARPPAGPSSLQGVRPLASVDPELAAFQHTARQAPRRLGPETRALLRANLKIVSTAEAQLRRAREADPDSAYLESLIRSAEQQKQDLHDALALR